MKKIFKYRVNDGYAIMPQEHKLIRVDYVNDSQYEGWFAWSIVDTEKLETTQKRFVGRDIEVTAAPFSSKKGLVRHEMKVKEKQDIWLLSPPVFAEEDDGKVYIYTEDKLVKREQYNICFYKTGQELPDNINDFTYIGLNRIWIVQELGLYTFYRKMP